MKLGQTSYLGRAADAPSAAALRRLLRPPAPRRRREDRPAAGARSATPTTRVAALAHRDRCAPPTTASSASRTAGCARRCSTPTRSRSASRSSCRARRCSASRARATRSSRSSTSCRRCSGSAARPAGRRRAATAATSARCCAASSDARARRRAVHLRRPPGRHRVPGRAGPAQPDPLRARRALEVRGLPRPDGQVAPEYELYDLEQRPRRGAEPRRQAHRARAHGLARAAIQRMHALLERACAASGTLTPALPPMPPRTPLRRARVGVLSCSTGADAGPGRER